MNNKVGIVEGSKNKSKRSVENRENKKRNTKTKVGKEEGTQKQSAQ